MAESLYNTFWYVYGGLNSFWNFLNSPISDFEVSIGDGWIFDALESIINGIISIISTIVEKVSVDEVTLTWLQFIIGYGIVTFVSFVIIKWFKSIVF